MIHYVTPPRSDDPATTPIADSTPPLAPAADAPPGPISWELSLRKPIGPPEPRYVAAPPKATTRSGDGKVISTGAAARKSDPIAATAVHSLGPVGRRRSPVLAFVLAVMTLGLHPILWVKRANHEMAQFDPRMVVRPGRSAGAVAFAALVPLLVAAAAAVRVVADHVGSPPSLPLSAHVTRWFLAAPALTPLLAVLVPLSLIALTMTLERVRVVEDRAGVDPEHQLVPAESMWWTALPVVGLAVYVARGQGRLNRVWEICSAPTQR